MTKVEIITMAVLAIAFFSTVLLSSCSVPEESKDALQSYHYIHSEEELEVLSLINEYRSGDLKELKINNFISIVAHRKSEQMSTNLLFNHDGFDQRSNEIKKVTGAKKVAENLAYNHSYPENVFFAWVYSARHNEVLLGDYTDFGISIMKDSSGRKYYTLILAKI
jgi:uncharacterized protein YkwD